MNRVITDVAALSRLLEGAYHVDVKQFEGDLPLRQFLAGMFGYNPSWMKALYGIRWGFVRLLGMKQEGIPGGAVSAESISFAAGASAGFFTVEDAVEDQHYIAGAKEKHLEAYLAVVVEPLSSGQKRFHVVTIVHYQHWTGPVYFNVIRPFHHLVVQKMGQAGLAVSPAGALA